MADAIDGQRGARFRAIREGLKLSQDEFAERLTEVAREVGVSASYSGQDVSKRETGRRKLDIDDYILAEIVDAKHRSALWLAYGQDRPHPMFITRPKKAKVAEG